MPRRSLPVRQDAKKMAYIEWLSTPPAQRVPRTEEEFAKTIDVYKKTLYNWRHEREFRDVWRDTSDDIILSGTEDFRPKIMETLARAAMDERNPRHVQAAKVYFDNVKAMTPDSDDEVGDKALGMLTDDELEHLLARGLSEQQRGASGAGED